jgi:hypothetical protein
MTNWSNEIENILQKIRINSVVLSDRHRNNFLEYKNLSKFFDVPIIVVSTISASFSVGSQSYMSQELVSTVTCSISMFITILSGIKLYLNLDNLIQNEVEMSKQFNLLSLDIFRVLNLSKDERTEEAMDFLNKKYNEYTRLIEASNLLRTKLPVDMLSQIDVLEKEVKLPNEMTDV